MFFNPWYLHSMLVNTLFSKPCWAQTRNLAFNPSAVLFNAQRPSHLALPHSEKGFLFVSSESQCNATQTHCAWMTDVHTYIRRTTNHPNLYAKFFGLGGPEHFTNVPQSQILESVYAECGTRRGTLDMSSMWRNYRHVWIYRLLLLSIYADTRSE